MKPLSDCRVLLVDDAKANLDILVEGLKSDHKLSLALNGEMALQIAARTPPDLVLLDIMMPGLDGYEVCRRLRQRPETAEVPIMFLSSLEEVQNQTRGFEAEANDYLTKPFDLLEVKARVRSLLKAKAYSDAVKEQIASELRVAREIQMGMLPHDFAGIERAYGVEIGTALGFEPGLAFERTDLTLRAGDTLVLYTDGVSEAFNPADECYGQERLLADAATFAGQPAPTLTQGLLAKVRAFAGSAPQSDDIAILALRVAGGPPGPEGGA